ncbi:response regulator [Aliikangiella marina]|uniref:Response regulator n=1 Tax=Aliikangiella marina TaxID=1712262 RepID=A0A545TDG6_9GAMM|nr:response regulator [Aliikangiella marina]TQV75259.1 response regulator [Aliikangiella marina]
MAVLKIAVIDDATMIRDLIKKFVRQNFPEAKIFDAVNGQAGMTLLKRQPVDLILCDWEMPEMSGEELLRWVRTQENMLDTPFIMVTSRGDKEFVIKAIEAKVSDYLVKPFNNKQFLEKIHRAFKKHGIQVPESALLSKPPTGRGGDSLAVLTAHSSAVPKANESPVKNLPKKPLPKGAAIVRTSSGEIKCALKQLDLKSMLGVFKASTFMPTLLEQVSLDLEFSRRDEQKIVRMNGFVQMLKSNEERPDSNLAILKVFFMDEDPQKRALISEYVGQFN